VDFAGATKRVPFVARDGHILLNLPAGQVAPGVPKPVDSRVVDSGADFNGLL
jgi:hypothetical protein